MGAYRKIEIGAGDPLIASALEWWRDAGVDVLVEDEVRDWLAAPAPQVAPAPAAPAADALPDTVEALATWRLGSAAPEAGWSGVTVCAAGPADARVMVLVDCPEREDAEAGVLLSGAAGRLFDRMLAAVGLSRDEVYLAAVCGRRPATGQMPRDTVARLGEVARHLVELVAPERLLLLGDATSRAVLATERSAMQGALRAFNHKGGEAQVVASHHPRMLLSQPRCKAESWRDLRLLMGIG